MSDNRELNTPSEKTEEDSGFNDSSDAENSQIDSSVAVVPEGVLEKRIFLYGFGITIILWLYIILKGGNALYFSIPAIVLTILVVVLFIRYKKRTSSTNWIETSFEEYKESKKHHHQEE